MPITIDQEAKQFLRSPFDISKMSDTYITDSGIFTFQSPDLTTINKHFYRLLRYSKEVEFQKMYKYRPDYLSYDEYGTVILDQLLLYVNGISSPEDFDLNKVIIPLKEIIIDILTDNFQKRDIEDMTVILW